MSLESRISCRSVLAQFSLRCTMLGCVSVYSGTLRVLMESVSVDLGCTHNGTALGCRGGIIFFGVLFLCCLGWKGAAAYASKKLHVFAAARMGYA